MTMKRAAHRMEDVRRIRAIRNTGGCPKILRRISIFRKGDSAMRSTAGAGLFGLIGLVLATLVPGAAAAEDPASQLDVGSALYLSQDYKAAAAEFANFVKKFPDHQNAGKAQYLVGDCRFRMKEYKAAAAAFDRLREAYPKSGEILDGTYALGECCYNLKDYAKAAKTFGEVVQREPGYRNADGAYYWLGESLYQQEKYAEARGAFGALVEKFPRSRRVANSNYSIGFCLLAEGKHLDSVKYFEGVVSGGGKSPIAAESQFKIGEAYRAAGKPREAETAYRSVLGRFEGKFEDVATVGLGWALFEQGRHKEALDSLQEAIKKYPECPLAAHAAFYCGQCQYGLKNYKSAAELFAKVAEDRKAPEPLAQEALYWKGVSLADAKESAAALEAFEKVLAGAKDKSLRMRALYAAGGVRWETQDYKGAVKQLDQFLREFPTSDLADDALYTKSLALEGLGDFAGAAGAAGELVANYQASDLCGCALFARGFQLVKAKDYAGAEKALGEYIAAAPDLAKRFPERYKNPRIDEATSGMAWALFHQKKLEAARDAFGRLAREFPRGAGAPEAAFMAARIARELGKLQEAAAGYRAYLAGFPKGEFAERAKYEMGMTRYDMGDFKAAAGELAQFEKEYPKSAYASKALLYAGESQDRLGAHGEAGAIYDQVLARYGRSPEAERAAYGRAHALTASDKEKEALESWETFLQKYPDGAWAADALFWIGRYREKAGEPEKALESFRKLLARYPDEKRFAEEGEYRAASLLYKTGDCRGAAAAYDKFLGRYGKGLFAAQAHYDRAWCAKELGDAKREKECLEALIASADASLVPDAHFMLGELLYAQALYAQAAEHYGAVLAAKAAGDLAEKTAYKLAWSALAQGKSGDALARFDKFLAQFPKSAYAPDAHYQAAAIRMGAGDMGGAAKGLARLIEGWPEDPLVERAYCDLVEAGSKLQNWEDVLRRARAFLDKFPRSDFSRRARFAEAEALRNMRDYREALALYGKVAEGEPTELAARAKYGTGECLFESGKYEEARSAYYEVVVRYGYPQWQAAALFKVGRCHEALRDKPEAKRMYDTLIKEFKDSPYAREAADRIRQIGD